MKLQSVRKLGILGLTISLLILTNSVFAQTDNPYKSRLSSRYDFEAIPIDKKISYAFTGLMGYSSHDELAESDLSLIQNTVRTKPSRDRTWDVYQRACDWYLGLTSIDSTDITYIAQQIELAGVYGREDKANHYLQAYEKLSVKGKQFIDARIEEVRGTDRMSSSSTSITLMAEDYPELIERQFSRYCEKHPQQIENYQKSVFTLENLRPAIIN